MTFAAPDRHLRSCSDGPSPAAESTERADRSDVTNDLLTRAHDEADPATRQELLQEAVLTNQGVACAVAARYRGRGVDGEDLQQVAFLGLVKAAQSWRPGRGPDFLAYAVPTMSGEIKRHFRDASRTIRPPRWIQELQAEAHGIAGQLTQDLGHAPSAAELGQALGVDRERVSLALAAEASSVPLSLDASAREDSPGSLTDVLGDEDPRLDLVETHLWLEPALAELTEREQQVVRLRFGAGWTQDQIGARLGVSQMQVSRVLRAVLQRLRTRLGASGDRESVGAAESRPA